jgi:hypothetical protein
MNVLPLISRELRIAPRQPPTQRLRALSAAGLAAQGMVFGLDRGIGTDS